MTLLIREKATEFFRSGGTFRQRVLRSGLWIIALRLLVRLFGFIRTIVLARLLAPDDFGLFGIAMLAILTLDTFSQTGFQAALIQKKEDIEPYLDTAWTIQALRGLGIMLLMLFCAPFIASFFEQPAAVNIIRVLSLTKLFQGFANIGTIYFQKNLEFHKQFIYQFLGIVFDLLTALIAAVLLKSVWALVLGLLAGDFIRMVVSYVISSYRPRLNIDRSKANELSHFGKWIFGTVILTFLAHQGDSIFVGKYLGATALGLFQLAYQISKIYADDLGQITYQLMLPTYAIIQDNLQNLRGVYLKVFQLSTIISGLLAGFIYVLSPDLTLLFLGQKWMPMVPVMQVLALSGFLNVMTGSSGSLFQGAGKPHLSTAVTFVRPVVMALTIYPLSHRYGVLGTGLSVLFSSIVSVTISSFYSIKVTSCEKREFAKAIFGPAIIGLFMVSIVYVFNSSVQIGGFAQLTLSIMIGLLSYFGLIILFDRFLGLNILSTVQMLVKK